MSWYGGQIEETRKLDTLLDSNPTLQQLLAFPSLLQQLQSYNPRLLQLLSESHPIMKEIIVYITEPPKEHDTDERKYRLPLYACEMITAETTCLINNFFKANPEENNTPYLVSAFRSLFSQGQVLPLLAGYFFKVNLVLISNRSPEAINCVYAYP